MRRLLLYFIVLSLPYKTLGQFGIIAGGHTSQALRDISNLSTTSKPFQSGVVLGFSHTTINNKNREVTARVLYYRKPDRSYDKPFNIINIGILFNPKLGTKARLNIGPVVELSTQKTGTISQPFISGLIGIKIPVVGGFNINLDYQRDILNPGTFRTMKIRSQTISFTAQYVFKTKKVKK